MIAPRKPGQDADEDDDEEGAAAERCPICATRIGECDHLVASIDLTYSEFIAGAMFAHERAILDLLENLSSSDPEALKAAGAGPVLEHLATLVRDETEEGATFGDAVSIYYPQIMAALSHLLQEDEEVIASAVDAPAADDSAVENFWARDPERVVADIIGRLQEIADDVEAADDE